MNEISSPIVRSGRWFFAILFLISGPVSACFLVPIYLTARASAKWPSVPGEVKRVEVGINARGRYFADVLYTYTVGGRELLGNRVRASDGEYGFRDGAAQAIEGLMPGQKVEVYYDPGEPARSVLRPGVGFPEYFLLLVPIGMSSIGIIALVRLRRCRDRPGGAAADPPVESRPHEFAAAQSPDAPESASETTRSLSIHAAVLNAWGDLLRSRESLLLRTYRVSILAHRPGDFAGPRSLEEARQQFDAIRDGPIPSSAERDDFESRMVLGNRVIAAWVVFWSTILPAGVLGWLVSGRIAAMHQPNGATLVALLVAVVILFPILCVAGLVIQSILVRPLNAVLGRIVAPADDSCKAGAADDERKPDA